MDEQQNPVVAELLRDAVVAPPQPAQPAPVVPQTAPIFEQQPPAPQVQYVPVPVPQTPAQPAPAAPPAPKSLLDLVTDEERETYKDALPMIERLIMAATSASAQEAAQARALAQQVSESSEQAFVGQVRSSVPNMDAVVNDPRWERFLNSYVPGTSFTQRDALAHAHGQRNREAVVSVFNAFNGAIAAPTTTATYGATPFAVPQSAATAVVPQTNQIPSTPSPQPQTLKWSVYDQASKEYTKGNMSREDFLALKRVYDPAINEGRVNYSM